MNASPLHPALVAVVLLAGCAAAPTTKTPDELVTEAVMRCQDRHAPHAAITSNNDSENLRRQMAATDHDRLVNTLRTADGWATVERRARRAQEPISKFCTLEIAVRLDPDKARALYADLAKNDDLGLYIMRDEYMKQALAPYLPPRKQ